MELIKNAAESGRFSKVAFTCRTQEPKDQEVREMVDELLEQLYGEQGLRAILKKGDHVTIKTNIVMCHTGAYGEKGRAIITDPRVTRCVAERVREVIGGDAELRVCDACFSGDANPSAVGNKCSFHWARLNRVPDDTVSPEDVCYDYDADGYLDGTSHARLVNLDAIGEDGRDLHVVQMADGSEVKVAMPRFLRTREQANGEGEFTDVLIGLPVMKNHWYVGMSGALKLHYGFRSLPACKGDSGRRGHSGFYTVWKDGGMELHHLERLENYLSAIQKVRPYDLVIMDCLTMDRDGPGTPSGAVSCGRDIEEQADYILTHSMLASDDPCAIDTVEAAFAGYRTESVTLPRTAARNGIGVADPAFILMPAEERFKFQKLRIAARYSPEGRYPLSRSGHPELLESADPGYAVDLTDYGRQPDGEGLHHIRYRVIPTRPGFVPKLSRADLCIGGTVVQSLVGLEGLEGEFTFRYADYDNMNHAYLAGRVCVWDTSFNCVPGYSEFFIAPDDERLPD